jgi:hypothetical protein
LPVRPPHGEAEIDLTVAAVSEAFRAVAEPA